MRVMTGELLANICYALHGPNWRTWAAERLDKTERTIRRYEQGESNIKRPVREKLLTIVQEQIKVLQAFERELS